MNLFKSILIITLFLLFVTIVTIGGDGNAKDRVRSALPSGSYDYQRPYMNNAHTPNNAAWQAHEHEPFGQVSSRSKDVNRMMVARFEESGLITGVHSDKNGHRVIEVGDLFLRLSDADKMRVIKSYSQIRAAHSAHFMRASYSIQHDRTNQFLGVLSPAGLQLQ